MQSDRVGEAVGHSAGGAAAGTATIIRQQRQAETMAAVVAGAARPLAADPGLSQQRTVTVAAGLMAGTVAVTSAKEASGVEAAAAAEMTASATAA